MKLIYLATPIDQMSRSTVDYSGAIAGGLRTLPDVAVYHPARAFTVGQVNHVDARLEAINRVCLEEADALIAVIPRGVPSIGVPREIEAFNQSGRPWAIMTDLHESFALADAPFVVEWSNSGVASLVSWVGGLPESDNGDSPLDLIFAKDSEHDGRLPTRAYRGDAGYDLYAAADTHIPYGCFRDVHCGVRVALPTGMYGRIVGRSSTLRKRNLLVSEGIIDTGYRGALFVGVRNLGEAGATVRAGERIAQLILNPNVASSFRPRWASADEFDRIPHDGRGNNGFGSSGE